MGWAGDHAACFLLLRLQRLLPRSNFLLHTGSLGLLLQLLQQAPQLSNFDFNSLKHVRPIPAHRRQECLHALFSSGKRGLRLGCVGDSLLVLLNQLLRSILQAHGFAVPLNLLLKLGLQKNQLRCDRSAIEGR